MFKAIRRRWAVLSAAAAAAVGAVLCCGCSESGIGEAFVIERLGGGNDCGVDGTAGSCNKAGLGGKTWMTENLNRKVGNSWCYDNKESNCKKYGRLYDWETAKTACPSGWRLPDTADWRRLVDAAGGYSVAGKALKSKFGWYGGGNGTDTYGFSALPGGNRYSDGGFYDAGYHGYWWTATEFSDGLAYFRIMFYSSVIVYEYNYFKSFGFSVRSVADRP